MSLITTNFLGQNTPAIAATEFDYVEMWAQDVGAMVGYDAGATSVAAALTPFSIPPLDLAGLAAGINAQVAGVATAMTAAISPAAEGAIARLPGVVAGVQSAAAAVPLQSVMQVAQIGMYPASMMMSPMMQLLNSANSAGLAGAQAAGFAAADMPKMVDAVSPMKGLGGAGLGAGMAADLGKARLVGAMSVPPTWEGSIPKGLSTSAMAGLGAMPAGMAEAGRAPMGMMPMPMGMGGAGAGMPGGMLGRGGASPHVVQSRPSVVPRIGVG